MHLEILIEFLLFVIAAVIFMRSVFLLSAVLNALVRNGRSVDYKPSWVFLIVQLYLMVQSGLIVKNITSLVSEVITKVLECLQSNRENCEHQKYFWNVIVSQEKSQSGIRKLNCKQER